MFKCRQIFNLAFFRVLEYRILIVQRNYFHNKVKKYESFSVTKKYVGRIKYCIGQEIQIVRQIILDMRNVLILIFLCINLAISGATYYVSPSGSDSNPGSISQPFFTLNKAWSKVSAGDIIYMRGGTYNYTSTQDISGRSGTSNSLINILAYPNELPILNFSGSSGVYTGIRMDNNAYIYIKGIRITAVPQDPNFNTGAYGLRINSHVTNCTFETMETDHTGGWGSCVWGDYDTDLLFQEQRLNLLWQIVLLQAML